MVTTNFDRIPHKLLIDLLNETDDFAVENVKTDRGGPFGASIHVYDLNTQELSSIGELEANAVLSTGMGSAHAEDQAMNPDTIRTLMMFLADQPAKAEPVVIFSSSGESCPACHSKEEILARTLIQKGLIKAGNFAVTYGATFEDTANVAGFNDAPYHEGMQKLKGTGMIAISQTDIGAIPANIAKIFAQSDRPVSVIEMPTGALIIGYDDRENDMMATSEVSAIRNAAREQKGQDLDTPWDLGKAKIYTSTSDVGPLGYAECQWANVTQWISVDHPYAVKWETQEAPDISNSDFFEIISSKEYNGAHASIEVKRLEPYENKAQYEWKEKIEAEADPDKILYNGIDLD